MGNGDLLSGEEINQNREKHAPARFGMLRRSTGDVLLCLRGENLKKNTWPQFFMVYWIHENGRMLLGIGHISR